MRRFGSWRKKADTPSSGSRRGGTTGAAPAGGTPLCRGGCRRDCFAQDGGQKNYYCEAYQQFFARSIGRLEMLAGRM